MHSYSNTGTTMTFETDNEDNAFIDGWIDGWQF